MKKTGYIKGFTALLFGGCVLFFNWPLLTVADQGVSMAVYLFCCWAMAIAGLWLVGRRVSKSDEKERQP